jgi:hypothetical protein
MNLFIIYGIRNKFANELLTFFQLHLFLELNCLPNNYYAVKTLIQKLGLDYKTIHACVKRCVLFQGDRIKILTDVQNVMILIIRMR